MDWVGLNWVGLDWGGLGWIGLDWVGLGWVGLDWIGLEALVLPANREKQRFRFFGCPLFRHFRPSRISKTMNIEEIYRFISKNLHFMPSGSVLGRFCVLCRPKIHRTSIEHLSKIDRKSIEHLSEIYRKSIGHLSETYRKSIENQ